MLDYADPHKLHISEMPSNLDEQRHIVKKAGAQVYWCEPVQIVREGDWAGVWRVTRVWDSAGLVGYVRFDLDDLVACVRPGLWDNEEMVTRWDIKSDGGFVSGLRNACLTLILYRSPSFTVLPEKERLCGVLIPDQDDMIGGPCNAPYGHAPDEPAHVNEHGTVWYE